jgi:hypothetical protein
MAKGFERYRDQICELYLHGDTLKQVRKKMKDTFDFDAG